MITNLTVEFERQAKEMEERQKLLDSMTANGAVNDSATVSGMRQELLSLREQLSRALNSQKAPRGDHTFHMATGQNNQNNGPAGISSGLNNGSITGSPGSLSASKRKLRRHSADDMGADVLPTVPTVPSNTLGAPNHRFDNPRAVSVAYAQTPNVYPEDQLDDPSEIIMRLLEDEEPLDEDVLVGLIKTLKVPTPSLQNPPSSKEVLFPAHLISLVTNEMWKYGLMRESERFLANVMQTIQQHVMVRVPLMRFGSLEVISEPSKRPKKNFHRILSLVYYFCVCVTVAEVVVCP